MHRKAPLGELTPREFLRRHWQKSPCLIRNAIPDITSPINPETLAGLACEAGVEARLIRKIRQRPGWVVQHAPLTEQHFTQLPARNWTLLVQDADKYVPALAELLDRFRFVPNWRIDDLMVSYATDGGGVGPHVDAYDVFLLQAQGFRRWSISSESHEQLERPGLELRQVRNFRPQQEWLLGPGDMLYLPPGVVHDGVAIGDGLTFSIGFRVAADAEMLADLAGYFMGRINPEARYGDAGLRNTEDDPGLIPMQTLRQLQHRLRNLMTLDGMAFAHWFGCFVTEPKPWLRPDPARRPLTPGRLRTGLANGLYRNAASLLCWIQGGKSITLFADGHAHTLPARLAPLAQLLCRERVYPAAALKRYSRDHAALELFTSLYNSGTVGISRKR